MKHFEIVKLPRPMFDIEKFKSKEPEANPAGLDAKAANGTEVGNPKNLEDLTKKEGEKNEKPVLPTPEEFKQALEGKQQAVQKEVQEHPEWPPGKDNPESEKRLAGELESGLNQVS